MLNKIWAAFFLIAVWPRASLARARRRRGVGRDGVVVVRDVQDRVPDRARPHRHDVPVARPHAPGREGRRGGADRARVRAALEPPVPRRTEGPSRLRRDDHEPVGQHARPRQRGDAARHQGDEGAAVAQPRPRARDRRADPLPRPQHRLLHAGPGIDLRLPRAARRRRPHRRLPAGADGHLHLDDGRAAGHRAGAASCGTRWCSPTSSA